MDKQAFWSRVCTGKERADTLAREVFCQIMLTRKSFDSDLDPEGTSDSDPEYSEGDSCSGSDTDTSDGHSHHHSPWVQEGSEKRSPDRLHERCYRHEEKAKRDLGEADQKLSLAARSGGIVRLHSVLETANELVSSRCFMPLHVGSAIPERTIYRDILLST